MLLVGQVALSLALVAAATFFVRSFAALSSQQLGFEPRGVVVATVDTTRAAGAERLGLYQRALDATRALPFVADAAGSYLSPVGAGAYTPFIRVGDIDFEDISANVITPGWFATLKTRIIAGRDFATGDAPGAPRVAIVNQAFARRMFGRSTPLGKTFTVYPHTPRALGPLTIIGVAEDMAYRSIRTAAPPTWFAPLAQFDVPQFPLYSVALMVRPREGRQERFTEGVGRAIASQSPQLTVTFRPLPDYIRGLVTRDRVMALLGGSFGALALLLASVGLYGVTTYTVSRQRMDIGIRLALGATRRRVLRGVAVQTMWRVVCGVALGLALSAYAWRFIASLLFGLAPRDPFTFGIAAVAFLFVAALAAGIPAWRASRIDPAEVLRSE
jgi:predicted permease